MASEEEVVIDLRKMKMADLKKELQLRGLKVSGNKQELIERLQQYLEEHEGAEVDDEILKEEEEEGETDDHLEDQKTEDAVLSPPPKDPGERTDEKAEKAPEAVKDEGEKDVADLHSPAVLTDAEKLKLRAQKFGMTVSDMNVEARKAARSERFGTGSAVGRAPTADADKLKKRAERFGGTVSDTLNRSEDEERRRKRQARFALNASADAGLGDVDKKKKRAERFGLIV